MAHLASAIRFAAAPIFAAMAWMTAINPTSIAICTGISSLLPVNDMVLMYLLMSIFHLSPWLKLWSDHFTEPHSTTTQTEGD